MRSALFYLAGASVTCPIAAFAAISERPVHINWLQPEQQSDLSYTTGTMEVTNSMAGRIHLYSVQMDIVKAGTTEKVATIKQSEGQLQSTAPRALKTETLYIYPTLYPPYNNMKTAASTSNVTNVDVTANVTFLKGAKVVTGYTQSNLNLKYERTLLRRQPTPEEDLERRTEVPSKRKADAFKFISFLFDENVDPKQPPIGSVYMRNLGNSTAYISNMTIQLALCNDTSTPIFKVNCYQDNSYSFAKGAARTIQMKEYQFMNGYTNLGFYYQAPFSNPSGACVDVVKTSILYLDETASVTNVVQKNVPYTSRYVQSN